MMMMKKRMLVSLSGPDPNCLEVAIFASERVSVELGGGRTPS